MKTGRLAEVAAAVAWCVPATWLGLVDPLWQGSVCRLDLSMIVSKRNRYSGVILVTAKERAWNL